MFVCVKWNENKVSERKESRVRRAGERKGRKKKVNVTRRRGKEKAQDRTRKEKQDKCIVYLRNESPTRRNSS